MSNNPDRSHYRKLCPYSEIDVYRVADLWGIKDHAQFHALKKLLCAGSRGSKNYATDIMEARESLDRLLEMQREDERIADEADCMKPFLKPPPIKHEPKVPRDSENVEGIYEVDPRTWKPKVQTDADGPFLWHKVKRRKIRTDQNGFYYHGTEGIRVDCDALGNVLPPKKK